MLECEIPQGSTTKLVLDNQVVISELLFFPIDVDILAIRFASRDISFCDACISMSCLRNYCLSLRIIPSVVLSSLRTSYIIKPILLALGTSGHKFSSPSNDTAI